MPDVTSHAPEHVRMRCALDVHKRTIVAAFEPEDPRDGSLQLVEIENTERALRRLVRRLGGAKGLAVCYEAGPCGYAPYRLLSKIGVACDVIAPSLTPRQPGGRIKTDRRDAKKLLVLHRAGALSFCLAPTPEQEGLRDLVRCRADLVDARRRARHRVQKTLLRYGLIYGGKRTWTKLHEAWIRGQRLSDRNAQRALEHHLLHLDALDAQLAALESEITQIARSEPWSDPARWLCAFRGIAELTALSLLAEIGDFRRFHSARELMSFLGLVPSEYSSGEQRHRGSITKTGNEHARRLLVEAAWHYQHAPRLVARQRAQAELVPAEVLTRAWAAQLRLHSRHRALTTRGKRSTVATTAVARELTGFIWAAMTRQPLREEVAAT
jgi:transposase